MRDFFAGLVGESFAGAAAWVTALLVVAVLLFLFVRVARRYNSGTFVMGGKNRKARLAVMDAAAIDSHRRLVLVRRDDVEHLILIGGHTDIVVEPNIRLAPRQIRPTVVPDESPDASPVAVDEAPADRRVPEVPAPVVAPPAPVSAAPRPADQSAPSAQRRSQDIEVQRPQRFEPAAPRSPQPPQPPQSPVPPRQQVAAEGPGEIAGAPAPRPQPVAPPPLQNTAFGVAGGPPRERSEFQPQRAPSAFPPVRGAPVVAPAAPAAAVAAPAQDVQTAPAIEVAEEHPSAPPASEFDDALLQELEITLDAPAARQEARRSQPTGDDALQDEMMKLLDDLSGARR